MWVKSEALKFCSCFIVLHFPKNHSRNKIFESYSQFFYYLKVWIPNFTWHRIIKIVQNRHLPTVVSQHSFIWRKSHTFTSPLSYLYKKVYIIFSIEESGEQWTVVFAQVVTEPASGSGWGLRQPPPPHTQTITSRFRNINAKTTVHCSPGSSMTTNIYNRVPQCLSPRPNRYPLRQASVSPWNQRGLLGSGHTHLRPAGEGMGGGAYWGASHIKQYSFIGYKTICLA
jgi:hypothetical protein